MINQGNNVPDNTIVIFSDLNETKPDQQKEIINRIIKKSTKKRDWFNQHFYKCLPLTIGNQYGFTISSEFDIGFEWDGGNGQESISFYFQNGVDLDNKFPRIESHFGSGIMTIRTPFTLRTPPGVNLMTINPPNHIIPNVTCMTGVIETDNIRRDFTFNLKIQIPNIKVLIPAGTPLAGFIPIPRYFADQFELKFADEVFEDELIIEELQSSKDESILRNEINFKSEKRENRLYLKGEDVYGNKFPDHQNP